MGRHLAIDAFVRIAEAQRFAQAARQLREYALEHAGIVRLPTLMATDAVLAGEQATGALRSVGRRSSDSVALRTYTYWT